MLDGLLAGNSSLSQDYGLVAYRIQVLPGYCLHWLIMLINTGN